MSEIIERIRRIIRVKLWARAKQQAMEKPSVSDTSSDDDSPSGGYVAGFIGIVVVIIAVGIFVLPLVSSMMDVMKSTTTNTTNQSMNLTAISDTMATMMSLIPLFMMLSLIMVFLRPMF